MNRVICFAVIAAALLTGALNISAMPSYDDVLLVVNKQSKSSVEIGNYFKAARKIPDINVVQVSMTDLQGAGMEDGRATVTQKQAMLAAIKKHMIKNRLTDKINYIVLTRGIPVYSDSEELSPGSFHLTDVYLMFNLSESAVNPDIPDIFTRNKYFYYYNSDVSDKKFVSKKFGYYVVARLDGPGVDHIKKMIDDTGYPAYDSWKKNGDKAKFFTLHQPIPAMVVNEVMKRNIEIVQIPFDANTKAWTATMDTVAKDLMFAYFNNVYFGYDAFPADNDFYGDGDMVSQYPFIYRGATFLPGSFATCFRSSAVGQMARNSGGLLKINLADGQIKDWRKSYDGSDMKFRHMTCVEYDPVNNQVWCGTGEPAINVNDSFDGRGTDEFYRGHMRNEGGGIARFDAATGNIAEYINANEPGSQLKNNRVVKIAYDNYGKRIWVAHYKGVQYYDLAAKRWNDVPALRNDFAAGCSIYVDPYDTDKTYFTFYCSDNGNYSKVSSQIAGAGNSVYEYSRISGTVTVYPIETADDSVSGEYPQMVKTDANTLWVTRGRYNYNSVTKRADKNLALVKYDLASKTTLEKIILQDYIPELKNPPLDAVSISINGPRAIVAGQNGQLTLALKCNLQVKSDPQYIARNYIFKVQSQPGYPSVTEVINHSFFNRTSQSAVPDYEIRSLVPVDQKKNDMLYAALSSREGGDGWIAKTSDGGKKWTTVLSSAKLSPVYGLALDGKQKLYAARGYQLPQNLLSDFMVFGLDSFGGGMQHSDMTYNPSPASAPAFVKDDSHIYAASALSIDTIDGVNCSQTEPMMFLYTDGFYMGEVRFASQSEYPRGGNGGYSGHMLVFEPKCAPFAPRVDEENMTGRIVNGKIEIPLRSPGLTLAEDGFIPATINRETVKVRELATGKPFTPDSITYDAAGLKIVISGNFTGRLYVVDLACGINGIKNIKGASLTNTRQYEWKDAVACCFGNGFSIKKQSDVYIPSADINGGSIPRADAKVDLAVSGIRLGSVPAVGSPLVVKFAIVKAGAVPSVSGVKTANIYLDNIKVGSVSFNDSNLPAAQAFSYTIDGDNIVTGGQHTVNVVIDAEKIVEERRESNNIGSAVFFIENRPDLSVSEITLSPDPAGNRPLTVYFKIANNGANATSAGPGGHTAAVLIDGKVVDTVSHDDIPKGGTVALQLHLGNGLAPGNHLVTVVADSAMKVAEINEKNNRLSKAIKVGPIPPLSLVVKNQSGHNAFIRFTGNSKVSPNGTGNIPIPDGGQAKYALTSIDSGRMYVSLDAKLNSDQPNFNNSQLPNSDYLTRFDKVEMTYLLTNGSYSGNANLTAVDFYGIPMTMETSIQVDTSNKVTVNYFSIMPGKTGEQLEGIIEQITTNKTPIIRKPGTNEFIRVLSPSQSLVGYSTAKFQNLISSLDAHFSVTLTGIFSKAGVPSVAYNYVGKIGNTSKNGKCIVLTDQSKAAHVINVPIATLLDSIYSCNGVYYVDNSTTPSQVKDNNLYAAVYRDLMVGFNLGFIINGMNDNAKWSNLNPFPVGSVYNEYAMAITENYGAYGFPFSDRYNHVLANLGGKIDTLTITILKDNAVGYLPKPSGNINPNPAQPGSYPQFNMAITAPDASFANNQFQFETVFYYGGQKYKFPNNTSIGYAGSDAGAQLIGIPALEGVNIYDYKYLGDQYEVIVFVKNNKIQWGYSSSPGSTWASSVLYTGL